MDAAWELGLDWFDTADAYGGGRSEAWIGDWIARDRQPAADHDEDVQPDGRRRRLGARAGARAAPARLEPGAARRRPRRPLPGARARSRRRRSTRRSAPSRSSPRRGLVEAYGRQQLRRRRAARGARRRHAGRCVQNSFSLLDRGDEASRDPALRGARARLPGVRPARRRLADRQVPARRAAARGLADDAASGAVHAVRQRATSTGRSTALAAAAADARSQHGRARARVAAGPPGRDVDRRRAADGRSTSSRCARRSRSSSPRRSATK